MALLGWPSRSTRRWSSVAVLLGTVVFVLLAAASTAMTRTVEMAQLSTLPVVVVSMVLRWPVPAGMLPGPVHWVAQVLPADPGGRPDVARPHRHHPRRHPAAGGPPGGIVAALLVLGAWVVAGALALRRFMRWEPRK